jgi:hypothetical protein
MSMKKFLAIAALGTVLAGPAFAQQATGTHREFRNSQPQHSTVARPNQSEIYERPRIENNNDLNPDFQLGGER